jgi:DNA-binding NtrC family response regulator
MDDILIAEDSLITAVDLKISLEELGYSVSGIVCNGEELLKRVLSKKPGLIISDINLEGELDGIEAIARLTETVSIPYIFITGFPDYKRIVDIYNLKPVAFLRKPIDFSKLMKYVEASLKKPYTRVKI